MKTCSKVELYRSDDSMAQAAQKTLAEHYGKKSEQLWSTLKNAPNRIASMNFESLVFNVGTAIFDTLGTAVDFAKLGVSSASECIDKDKVCFQKMFALTNAEMEKLKVKVAGFECLNPESQASMLTMAMIGSIEGLGLSPEELLIQKAVGKTIAKKIEKNKENKDFGPERRMDADVQVARSVQRQSFIDEFPETRQKSFFTRLSSSAFVNQANHDLSGNSKSRRLYFIRENSQLKAMNDETHDFDFVTSVNLFDQMNFDNEIDLLLSRGENADLLKALNKDNGTLKYRDGKTFQGSFSLEGLTAAQEERLVKLINDACTNTMNSGKQRLEKLHGKRSDDVDSELPDNLASSFKCGVGNNHIAAGHAARDARNTSHVAETELSDFRNYGAASSHLVAKANGALEKAMEIKGQIPGRDWAKLWNKENGIFNLDVYEALRKSSDSRELVFKMKEYTGVEISGDQAGRLMYYKKSIDALSPNFLDEGAEILHFDNAHLGGLKSDFPNVGARNFESLALALKDTKAGEHGENLHGLPLQLKVAEERVTKSMGEQKKALGQLVREVFGHSTCTKTSGDDGASAFDCLVPRETKLQFLSQASKSDQLRSTRFAFFADNVNPTDRMGLANHGEFLEKSIKSSLRQSDAFSKEDLKNLTMAIDLQGQSLWQGKIDILVANENKLTPQQKRTLDLAFDSALKKLSIENHGHSDYSRASRFYDEKIPIPEK